MDWYFEPWMFYILGVVITLIVAAALGIREQTQKRRAISERQLAAARFGMAIGEDQFGPLAVNAGWFFLYPVALRWTSGAAAAPAVIIGSGDEIILLLLLERAMRNKRWSVDTSP